MHLCLGVCCPTHFVFVALLFLAIFWYAFDIAVALGRHQVVLDQHNVCEHQLSTSVCPKTICLVMSKPLVIQSLYVAFDQEPEPGTRILSFLLSIGCEIVVAVLNCKHSPAKRIHVSGLGLVIILTVLRCLKHHASRRPEQRCT